MCPVPPREDGTKHPIGPWKRYQTIRPDEGQLRAWYGTEGRRGLGLICGAISGNLEMLEFEGKAVEAGLHLRFRELAEQAGLGPVLTRINSGYTERTPSGGLHLLYRCEAAVEGNTKLARRPATSEELAATPQDRINVLIETRGEGGYVITAPSNGGVHPTGGAWTLLAGGFDQVATITAAEREALLDLARSLDQMPHEPAREPAGGGRVGERPGDDFNARARWSDILEPYGWRALFVASDGNQHWRRPGKSIGTSATISERGDGLLYVFTSSTEFDAPRAYSKFGAYVALAHGGNFADAAAELRRQGYGGQAGAPGEARQAQQAPPTPEALAGFDALVEGGMEWAARAGDQVDALVRGVLVAGGLGFLISDPKAGKTWFAMELAICVTTGRPLLQHYPVERTGRVLYVATEGRRDGALARLRSLALGHDLEPDHVLGQMDFIWRRGVRLDDSAFIAWLTAKAADYALIIVDVLVDAWDGDENKADQVSRLLRGLRPVTDTGATVLLLHHLSKGAVDGSQSLWQRLRGSTAFRGAYDSGIALERSASARRTKVSFEHRDDAPVEPFTFTWPEELVTGERPADLAWQAANDDLGAHQQAESKVLAAVQRKAGMSKREVADAAGGRRTAAYSAIDSLVAGGRLKVREEPIQTADGRARFREGYYLAVPRGGNRKEPQGTATSPEADFEYESRRDSGSQPWEPLSRNRAMSSPRLFGTNPNDD